MTQEEQRLRINEIYLLEYDATVLALFKFILDKVTPENLPYVVENAEGPDDHFINVRIEWKSEAPERFVIHIQATRGKETSWIEYEFDVDCLDRMTIVHRYRQGVRSDGWMRDLLKTVLQSIASNC